MTKIYNKIAIVGSRTPDKSQVSELINFLTRIESQRVIISECARGIDETALREHKTIGVIPWKSYNPDVQR